MKKKYKVSVIMAVYNVEPFLREAVDSVIAQDIGFENIQLILVDDGSPDNSGAICDEYQAKYPENIVVIHKENGGVSSARNKGLDWAEGELVNFLDADDKVTPETFQNVYRFYQVHKFETDIVAVPMIFFDGKTGSHPLNYKFNGGSRIIDLGKEWNVCQLQSGAAFINAECLKELRFDPRLSYAEDAKLVQRVLAGKWTMGVMNEGAYQYRKRTSGAESAIQSSLTKKGWYLPYLEYFQEETIQFYLNKFGFVPRFIQYVLMYDLQWRFSLEHLPVGVLSEQEAQDYFRHLYGILQYIDDEVILAQRNIHSEHKIFALKKKHGRLDIQVRENDIAICCGSTVAATLSQCNCAMEFLHIQNGSLELEGRLSMYSGFENDISLSVCANGTFFNCEAPAPEVLNRSFGEPIMYMCPFKVRIPLAEKQNDISLTVWMRQGGQSIHLASLSSGTFFPVSGKRYQKAYAVRNGWKITMEGHTLHLIRVTPKQVKRCERDFLKEMWSRNDLGARKAVIARILRNLLIRFKRKPLWLISDRASKAGDNGEAFFRYMCENHPEIRSYYVIIKDCPDYRRMKKLGPVLAKDSFMHKLLVLMCDYNCSSQGEADVYNPFIGYSEPYRDYLSENKFIFLQHGIIHNDLSDWLDRYKKNICGFVTSTEREYRSIVDGDYHYTEKQIWLTGLPRFDRLYAADEKQITIMPTWRRYLFGDCSRETKVFPIGQAFLDSEYLAFYNGLLNHPRLLEAAKRYGYTIAFFPHPNVLDHIKVFRKNDQVIFLTKGTEYRDVYAKSAMVVTDYSSAVFDFAYLKKPLIYTQFDKETFYSGAHTLERGYFDYEQDGFGEVEYTLEDTVNRLIEYMENGCKMKEKYLERVNRFFCFHDKNNCQRVYDKIMSLDAGSQSEASHLM